MILENLGVYGWKEADENLALASLVTGDPLLLIGSHGCAKTHLASRVSQALQRRFVAYDASKAMFEDVLGYPNVEKLKHGVVEYVPSPVTVWDKEMVMIDEINRAVPELQNKWLEVIRSRKIMGLATQVKWVWSAMNPSAYSATNVLDEALIGRFAFFLYPPELLAMDERDGARVAQHATLDDAPALYLWTTQEATTSPEVSGTHGGNDALGTLLARAGTRFISLKKDMAKLPALLVRLAHLVAQESKRKVVLDGRRLGFIYRNLLSNRAVELAKADLWGTPLPDFGHSARYVVRRSVPLGLAEDDSSLEASVHQLETCLDLLGPAFEEDGYSASADLVYELFTTTDPVRRVELLLTEDLGELARSKAWSDLVNREEDLTPLAYAALQIESRRSGAIPQELLVPLSSRIRPESLGAGGLRSLEGDAVEYVEELEDILAQSSELASLVAHQHVNALVNSGVINLENVQRTREIIRADVERLKALLAREPGGTAK